MVSRLNLFKLFFGVLLMMGVLSLGAQELSVGSLDQIPRFDGVVEEGEYLAQRELGKMIVSAGWKDNKLYLALSGETEGWIAAGFGSTRMHKADMVIGFVLRGLPTLREQEGLFHGHRDRDDQKLTSWGMQEQNGRTTLEMELPLHEWRTDEDKILLILAMGNKDNLSSMHKWYDRLVLKIQ